MKYYAYKGSAPLGSEPLGSDSKLLFELTTDRGARARARRLLGNEFRLYAYVNFYDEVTFREVL